MANDAYQHITRRGLLASGAVIAAGLAEAQVAGAAPKSWRRRQRFDGLGCDDWPTAAHDLAATRSAARLAGTNVLWNASFPGGVPATAAIAHGRVYAASGAGAVAALNLEMARRCGSDSWARRNTGVAPAYASSASSVPWL